MSFKMFSLVTGYIYFAQMENTGPIKIGISNDPNKRMATLNTSSPYPINLIYFTPGCEEDEKSIHWQFRDFLIRNEWFHPDKKIFRMIEWKKCIDRKNGFFMWENYNPERDLGDWSLGSPKWDEPWAIEIQNRIELKYKQQEVN
jgi:hypothetical protein